MGVLFLTSALDLYAKDENRNRVAHKMVNNNGIVEILQSKIKKYDRITVLNS